MVKLYTLNLVSSARVLAFLAEDLHSLGLRMKIIKAS